MAALPELHQLGQLDQQVDKHQGEIIKFLGKLSQRELIESQVRRVTCYLAISSYLEQIGDVIETNLVAIGSKRLEKRIKASESTMQLIRPIHVQVLQDLRSLIAALATGSEELLREVAGNKSLIQGMADQAQLHLAKRLVADEPNRRLTYQFETDIIENLKRMHTLIRRAARSRLSINQSRSANEAGGEGSD